MQIHGDTARPGDATAPLAEQLGPLALIAEPTLHDPHAGPPCTHISDLQDGEERPSASSSLASGQHAVSHRVLPAHLNRGSPSRPVVPAL